LAKTPDKTTTTTTTSRLLLDQFNHQYFASIHHAAVFHHQICWDLSLDAHSRINNKKTKWPYVCFAPAWRGVVVVGLPLPLR
jgi:hypothetical protein